MDRSSESLNPQQDANDKVLHLVMNDLTDDIIHGHETVAEDTYDNIDKTGPVGFSISIK